MKNIVIKKMCLKQKKIIEKFWLKKNCDENKKNIVMRKANLIKIVLPQKKIVMGKKIIIILFDI